LQFPLRLAQFLDQDRHFMQMHVVKDAEQAPNAVVDIELLERFEACARYRLKPVTGVRHQLRVQMAHLGLPILNDQIYPVLQPEPSVNDLEAHYRMPLQLLAKRLAFTDPVSGEAMSFISGFEIYPPV
jgi:tRNA pseudouridine32 synthase/23S rRNA pseudouridine746 synthase